MQPIRAILLQVKFYMGTMPTAGGTAPMWLGVALLAQRQPHDILFWSAAPSPPPPRPPGLMGWCRGGSLYVEGGWGFPYLKIEKLLGFTTSSFHVF